MSFLIVQQLLIAIWRYCFCRLIREFRLTVYCVFQSSVRCYSHILNSFRHINGILCCYIDFYICHVENNVISNTINLPQIHCRHIDNWYAVVNSENRLRNIKQATNILSQLKYTYEFRINNKLLFLDANVKNKRIAHTKDQPTFWFKLMPLK